MKTPYLFRATVALACLSAPAAAQISFDGATNYALTGPLPDGVAIGDFDRVNGPDFAVTTSPQGGGVDRVELFQNQGTGTFVAGQVVLLGANAGPAALVAVDIDGDVDLDLAVCLHGPGSVQLLINNAGVFSLGASVPVGGAEPRQIVAGDFDQDGDADLVTSNRDSNNLSLLRNDGGVFVAAGLVATGTDPRHLVMEDLDGDCRLDLAVAAADSRRLEVYPNTGAGSFGAPTLLPIPGNEKPTGLSAADLDADGDIDLATTSDNNGIGLACVFTNTGGGFSGACYLTGGQNPGAIIAADLDADGDKDLAVADEDTNVVNVLSNLGANVFMAAGAFGVGTNPSHLAAADLDANGSIDLVTPNRDSNNASVLRNSASAGASSFCVALPNSVGAGARIDSSGSLSLAANAFVLHVRCAPPNRPGLFFFGTQPRNLPFGNGRRCAGGPTRRVNPPTTTSGAGGVQYALDFTQGAGALIPAAATRYFQFWHRDSGGSQYNTTDGLSATFAP